jgi:hypothetical protein
MRLRPRRPSLGSMAASTSRSTTTTGWRPGIASDRRSLTACVSPTARTRATHNSRLQGGSGANVGRQAPVSMAGGNRAVGPKSALAGHGRLATRVSGFRHRNRRPCAVPEGVASTAAGFADGHHPLSHRATARVHHRGGHIVLAPATVRVSRHMRQRGGGVPSLPERSVPAVKFIATHQSTAPERRRR